MERNFEGSEQKSNLKLQITFYFVQIKIAIMKEKQNYKGIATVVVLGSFLFFGIKGCLSDSKAEEKPKQETNADYVVSKYFKDKIVTEKISKQKMIELAAEKRYAHGDKEGGIIKFYEPGADLAWGYVEYHYPANPAKANDKDVYDDPIEVKIF